MTEEEKKTITREKHPGRVAQGHKLAALMKKKEEILCSKEQYSVQSSVQSTVLPTVQSTAQSNDTYVYGVDMLAVLAIGVCVFLACNTFHPKNKKPLMKNKVNHQNDFMSLKNLYNQLKKTLKILSKTD